MTTRAGLVVVAAGEGRRFGGPKQLALLHGKPVVRWCLEAFDTMEELADRVLVLPSGLIDDAWARELVSALEHDVRVVAGGATRAESVAAGAGSLDAACDVVVVHDGARPFPPLETTRECVMRLAQDSGLAAVVVAAAATDTLKRLRGDSSEILETVDRAAIVRAETPQVARRTVLLDVLGSDATATDEAQALERAGHRTAVVLHESWNPKITTPRDLRLAEGWLATGET